MKKINKAVIAVAGSGTRFLPATKAVPKEMLPIIDKPIIQLVVEELVEAGITKIIFVTRSDKKPLEDHFDHSAALEYELDKSGKTNRLKEVSRVAEMANFAYIRQKGPYGNGAPLLSAADWIKETEDFVYCFGDDIVMSYISFTKQMISEYMRHGSPIIGVQEVPRDQVNRYGIVETDKENRMLSIIEKPSIIEAPSNYASFGRMILNQEILEILKKTECGKDGELWMTDAIKEYVARGGTMYVKPVENGQWYTTGDPISLFKANFVQWMDHGSKEEILEFVKEYI